MANKENDDELQAKKWLESQGCTDICRPSDDPPDYMVGKKCAIEVMRLNLSANVNGKTQGIEELKTPLFDLIKYVLAKLELSNEGHTWYVDFEYDYCSKLLPNKNIVEREMRKALQPFVESSRSHTIELLPAEYLCARKYEGELEALCSGKKHRCLPCGICLDLILGSAKPAKFELIGGSNGKGILLLPNLTENINRCIKEKSSKVAGKRVNNDWWLLLIDYIGLLPKFGLLESDLKSLLEAVRPQDPWVRIIIISSRNIHWSYEFRGLSRTKNVA